MQMMQRAGQAAFAHEFGLVYLQHHRPSVVSAVIIQHKGRYIRIAGTDCSQQFLALFHGTELIFDSEPWRTVPYVGSVKSPVISLYDVGDRVIRTVATAERFESRKSPEDVAGPHQIPMPTTAYDVLSSLLDVNDCLEHWLADFRKGQHLPLYNTKRAELWPEMRPETLSQSYHFSSINVASMLSFFVSSHDQLLHLGVSAMLTELSGITSSCCCVLYCIIRAQYACPWNQQAVLQL
jgi:hypothetical protein